MVHSSIGRKAQRIGATAEQRVITELGSSGWSIEISSELDYAKKTETYSQHAPKVKGSQYRLRRGISPQENRRS